MFAHLRKTQLASQHCVGSLAGRRLSNVMAANRHNMFFLHIVTINRYISSANIVMDSAFQFTRYLLLSFLSLFQQNKMTKDIASIQYYSLSTGGVFTSSWVSSLFTFFWFSQLFFCISLSSGLAVYQLLKGGEHVETQERQFWHFRFNLKTRKLFWIPFTDRALSETYLKA